MANNSSNICWQPNWFWTLGDNVNFAQYVIILPLYATVGLLGHVLLASVFLKQAKNEKAYMYQIFLEVTESLDNFVFSLFMLAFLGAGVERTGYEWYQKIYFLMWYAAHLAIPLYNSLSLSCLLLSVSMAADRAFALLKPFVYKSINHKRHQRVALTLSLVLGFGITFFNVRLFEVQNGVNHYVIGVDAEYVGSMTSIVLSHFCNVARMIGLLALIICNVGILRSFRQHMSQKTKITTTKSSTNDMKRAAKEKATEKSLLLLTITQSFFMAVTMFSYVIFYTAVYVVPLFNVCDHLLYAPLLNSIIMSCDVVNTCVVVAMNRKSRDLLLKIFCFHKNWKVIKVGSSTNTTSNVTSNVVNDKHETQSIL